MRTAANRKWAKSKQTATKKIKSSSTGQSRRSHIQTLTLNLELLFAPVPDKPAETRKFSTNVQRHPQKSEWQQQQQQHNNRTVSECIHTQMKKTNHTGEFVFIWINELLVDDTNASGEWMDSSPSVFCSYLCVAGVQVEVIARLNFRRTGCENKTSRNEHRSFSNLQAS